MSRFVKLTEADGLKREIHVRADTISLVTIYAVNGRPTSRAYVHRVDGLGHEVTESVEQILALLAEPAPSVEVTERAIVEANRASGWRCRGSEMRAAIEAADRARGLRP